MQQLHIRFEAAGCDPQYRIVMNRDTGGRVDFKKVFAERSSCRVLHVCH